MRPTLPRLGLLALLAALAPAGALAADYAAPPEVLRGTYAEEPLADDIVQWGGVYVGGFAGYSQVDFDFTQSMKTQVGYLMRNTSLEKEFAVSDWLSPRSVSRTALGYGVFAGYNYQVDEIVLGLEADWTHTNLRAETASAISRTAKTADGYVNDVALIGKVKGEINDYGTLRARLGYTSGSFMPFLTGGLALGYGTFTRQIGLQTGGYHQPSYDTVYANYIATGKEGVVPTYGYSSFDFKDVNARTLGAGQTYARTTNTLVAGVAAGVGIDVAVTQNIFARAEYQYVLFDSFEGNQVHVNTVRAAAGVRW